LSGFHRGSLALVAEQWRRLLGASLAAVAAAAALVATGLALASARAADVGWARLWVRELAPLVAALVGAARLGPGLAGELGAMRVGDQIDALVTLGGDPRSQLVAPRVIAALAALPALAALADAVGLAIGWGLTAGRAGGPATRAALDGFARGDVLSGLARASLSGVALAAVGCALGLAVRGGAREVGRAAARAGGASLLAVLALQLLLGLVASA